MISILSFLERFFLATSVFSSILLLACSASAVSPSREAYIVAHDHGFVELEIADHAIPVAVGSRTEARICSIELLANREPVLEESLYPAGEHPPFSLSTGFRFSLTVGTYVFQLSYEGCGLYEDRDSSELIDSTTLGIEADVGSGMVTKLFFNGESLVDNGATPSSRPSLETISAQLQEARGCE